MKNFRPENFDEARHDAAQAQYKHRRLMPGNSVLAPQLLRSSIFATCARMASSKRDLPAFDDLTDTSRDGSVEYRGAALVQADLRVLLALVERAQGMHGSFATITFNATEFLADIGRSTCSRSLEALRDSLANLRSATFTVREHARDRGVVFGFVDEVAWEGREFSVKLSPKAPLVLHELGHTYIDTASRKLLADGVQTALADVLAATKCDSLDVDALAAMWNRTDVAQVGKDVRHALEKLQAVGIVDSWMATRGRVHVVRT